MKQWLEWEIAQWVHQEGSIWQPITPWTNAFTTATSRSHTSCGALTEMTTHHTMSGWSSTELHLAPIPVVEHWLKWRPIAPWVDDLPELHLAPIPVVEHWLKWRPIAPWVDDLPQSYISPPYQLWSTDWNDDPSHYERTIYDRATSRPHTSCGALTEMTTHHTMRRLSTTELHLAPYLYEVDLLSYSTCSAPSTSANSADRRHGLEYVLDPPANQK